LFVRQSRCCLNKFLAGIADFLDKRFKVIHFRAFDAGVDNITTWLAERRYQKIHKSKKISGHVNKALLSMLCGWLLQGGGAIGSAVARICAREGARVFIGGWRHQAEAVAADITGAGGTAETAQLDAFDQRAVEKPRKLYRRKV
jgi:hypothetical protein